MTPRARAFILILAAAGPAQALNDSTSVVQQWPAASFNANGRFAGIYMYSSRNNYCQRPNIDTGTCSCDFWAGYVPVQIWSFDSDPDKKFYTQGDGYMELYQCVKLW